MLETILRPLKLLVLNSQVCTMTKPVLLLVVRNDDTVSVPTYAIGHI